jgi:DNA mismatch endonuclease (patch repair protein)
MADVLTPQQRSFNMSRIRSRDTRPEMRVRSIIHRMGYRFSLHRRDLPGKPDLVLRKHNTVIFVHGCFFHMHSCKYGRVVPATNPEFWRTKRLANVSRDHRNKALLEAEGWRVLEVWECQVRSEDLLKRILRRFLRQKRK